MERTFGLIGSIAAVAGMVTCLAAGLARLMGSHYFLGFESVTLFIGGIALMVLACLARLEQLLLRCQRSDQVTG